MKMEIKTSEDYHFEECLIFLGRSDQELLHKIRDGYVYKLLKVDQEPFLIKIGYKNEAIQVEFPLGEPSANAQKMAMKYVVEWFDLNRDLMGFYQMAQTDEILNPIVRKYRGLRIIGIPDLFEALTWAIIGQQINLTFAYTLKKRFVERFGESLTFEGETYWLFPPASQIAEIDIEALRKLQFTARKAEYVIGVAQAMAKGELSKEILLQKQDDQQIHNDLTKLRGIGAWSADYVMMKCLQKSTAFPIADVGLHNAIRVQLGLDKKPTIQEIEEMSSGWTGWEAYAVFYLWRSLYV
ncbi:DNA-3-methyladenine glycosylase II [Bacillus sp. SORGH_AS 510]|uniref:DNA-3-methyladenine glycosylase family protein n=1 Tax=Bacillus sp. SORGH_AS_0510 TaxID=3041771 RepID=UPI002782ADF9|nr:DNA-3-methyladenine glycosylase [Bacillus sp. SORGH_AS_0510]MDQ1143671.1 DNA-3-methyladenine glycosylase II [Bacillus sp. SORGH_AS_0510]